MKKIAKIFICTIIAVMLLIPSYALAADTPELKSIQFSNATFDLPFAPGLHEFGIKLTDPNETPAVENYELTGGDADVLITYDTDAAMRQTGITVTLEYENGSTIYRFYYTNPQEYTISSNNNLAELSSENCELYPALSSDVTDYKLYVPKDMEEMSLVVRTEDSGAHCDMPTAIRLNPDTEQNFSIVVTASDESVKQYNVKIKYLDMTTKEVQKKMADPEFTSLVEDSLFYKRPEFNVIIISIVGGLVLLAIFIIVAKRLTVKVDDEDEEEFFAKEEIIDSEE